LKDHISALDVNLNLFKSQPFVQHLQRVTGDFFVSAHVDAAKEGDKGVHGKREEDENILTQDFAVPNIK
jgi:hypothetical protein